MVVEGAEETGKKDKELDSVPFFVFESEMARAERKEKRQWATIMALIAVIVVLFSVMIFREKQFSSVTTTQEVWQDSEAGSNNLEIVGGDKYGSAESQDYDEKVCP